MAWNICKGSACALHLTPEYEEGMLCGILSGISKDHTENPYDFWNEYVKHYAWDIGFQKGAVNAKCADKTS